MDISYFQLLQFRGAIKLEIVGMRHSSGRSVAAHCKRIFGLPKSMKKEEVLKIVEGYIEECKQLMEADAA
jgi:hypothetical protein